ncbi:MAG: hypothetical protein GEU94_13935 [Micromonosporaceae bacterium]|nr:hypothetical protein [Micromonosporaceae bacterium]
MPVRRAGGPSSRESRRGDASLSRLRALRRLPTAGSATWPPRWLLVAAWCVIAAQITVAGFLLADDDRPARPGREPGVGAVQGRSVAGLLEGSAPSGQRSDLSERAKAVRTLLKSRARAILRRDREAFLATVDPANAALRDRQAAYFHNLAHVPLASWSYGLDLGRDAPVPPGVAAAYGEEVWAPGIQLRYALRGSDTTPTSQQQWHLFTRRDQRWYLADDGLSSGHLAEPGAGTVANLWDFGPVKAISTPSVLVLGHPGSESLMRSVLAIAADAVPAVSAVWRDWSRQVVVLVPSDAGELGQLIEDPGDLSRMAAFASADVRRSGPPVGKRVLVNPAVFGELSPYGRKVVLTHEITHVATRHVTSAATPYWLAEGFADHVAHRSVGSAPRGAARELARGVRAGRLPDRLPTAGDFDSGNSRLAQAYQSSWLACRLIAERFGDATLTRLYERLSRPAGDPDVALDLALRQELDLGTADFVALWRAYLDKELGDK